MNGSVNVPGVSYPEFKEHTEAENPHGLDPETIGAAPAPIISKTDITAGSTSLATGQSYHVYE